MKLHNHTLKYLSIALLLIVGIWGFFFYLNLKKQLNKSLDQRLVSHKIDIIQAIEKDRELLTQTAFWGYTYHIVPLQEKEALAYRDHYQNTTILFQDEKTVIPGRKLTTAFRLDDHYYELAVATSTLETDELEQRMLYAMIALYLALLVSIIFVHNLLLKQVWKPFYALIKQAEKFRLGSNQTWETHPTKVTEFQSLNETLQSLIARVEETYQSQKQFIENAAHELQTPVASSLNRLELLLEKEKLADSTAISVSQVIRTLERLARLNRSLLLLTKIENKQYQHQSQINFNELTQTLIHDFEDMARHKNIRITLEASPHPFLYTMNRDLAEILLMNLIKNALVHNVKDGQVVIKMTDGFFCIANTGQDGALNSDQLFERFYKESTSKQSTGLGLAIVKAIVELYSLTIRYAYDESWHRMEIRS